jgi:hypothetical protein
LEPYLARYLKRQEDKSSQGGLWAQRANLLADMVHLMLEQAPAPDNTTKDHMERVTINLRQTSGSSFIHSNHPKFYSISDRRQKEIRRVADNLFNMELMLFVKTHVSLGMKFNDSIIAFMKENQINESDIALETLIKRLQRAGITRQNVLSEIKNVKNGKVH